MYSLLGEMKFKESLGRPKLTVNGTMSLVTQKPWIVNDTVRNNNRGGRADNTNGNWHGDNSTVNTIIVDFRSLDTLAEVAVLAIAGFGVYALLKLRIRREDEEGDA